MIRLRQVSKIYNEGGPNRFTALREVSAEIPENRVTLIHGPSGSGKSTLLALIGVMLRPTAGRIFIGKREITHLPERFASRLRREQFGFIFQHGRLLPGRSILENVMLPAFPDGVAYKPLRGRALSLLGDFGLAERWRERPSRLSGGEQQRVAIARALINGPRYIIADEPTAHLDAANGALFMETMQRLRDQGRTIIIAGHDPLISESTAIDATIELRDGRVVPSEARS